MNNVFVLADGKQYGPYSLEKVASLVANGVFTKKHLFSADGKDWVSFSKLPNPSDSLPPPPAKLDPNFLQHRGFLLGEPPTVASGTLLYTARSLDSSYTSCCGFAITTNGLR